MHSSVLRCIATDHRLRDPYAIHRGAGNAAGIAGSLAAGIKALYVGLQFAVSKDTYRRRRSALNTRQDDIRRVKALNLMPETRHSLKEGLLERRIQNAVQSGKAILSRKAGLCAAEGTTLALCDKIAVKLHRNMPLSRPIRATS